MPGMEGAARCTVGRRGEKISGTMQGADYDGQQTPRGSAYMRHRRSNFGPAGRLLGEVADRGQRPAIGIVSAYALRRAGNTVIAQSD